MSTYTIVARRQGRGDKRYTVGQVMHAPKVSAPGGGPDGHYYVVLRSRLHAPNEDLGHYDWTESAEVRAATEDEAARHIAKAKAPAPRPTTPRPPEPVAPPEPEPEAPPALPERADSIPEVDALVAAAPPILRAWMDAHRPRITALAIAKRHKDVSAGRLTSLTLAAELGADAATLNRLVDASLRVSRTDTILLPAGHYATAHRGKSWCRSGTGASARWADQRDGQFRVGPGKWLIHSDDGGTRQDNTTWDVDHIHLSDQVWTVAY